MTSLCRNLAVFLLFLSASPLLHPHLFTDAASTSRPITHPRILFMTGLDSDDDYDDEYADNHSSPPEVLSSSKTILLNQKSRFCQHDPCSENQEPCPELSKRVGCLCPGVSGADEPPHPPRIQGLVLATEGDNKGKIEVHWCAPSSVVSGYRVMIEGREGSALEFGGSLRRGLVGSLEVGTKVCVEAVNKAGHSIPSDFSCKRYDSLGSSDHVQGLAWVIGGGVALLTLLIIAAVIFWRYQMYQKTKRDSADGLGNPSYSTEGTL